MDDEPEIRRPVSIILKSAGYEVTTASNGAEALERIKALRKKGAEVDILITDIRMPRISGIELLDELEKNRFHIPVLAITGYGDKKTMVELMQRGCADCIEKPFNAKEILTRLEKIFDKLEKEENRKRSETEKLIAEKAELARRMDAYTLNFEKMRKQLESAVGAYRNLVHIPDRLNRFDLAWIHHPLQDLGGDFVDIRETREGCDILIADVAGHDMGASYHTIMLKAFFDENVRTRNSGESFFKMLNQSLLNTGEYERMITAVFTRINLEKMQAEIAAAGHPPPIIHKKGKQMPESVDVFGDVLGIHEDIELCCRTIDLMQNDRIFLFTDGFVNLYQFDETALAKKRLSLKGLIWLILEMSTRGEEGISISDIVKQMEYEIISTNRFRIEDDLLFVGVEIP